MSKEATDDYKEKSLDELVNDWQAGKLNDEQKDYVISQIPVLGFIDRNKDYSDQ